MDIVTADQNAPPIVKDLKVSASLLGPRVLVVPVPLQVFLIFARLPLHSTHIHVRQIGASKLPLGASKWCVLCSRLMARLPSP